MIDFPRFNKARPASIPKWTYDYFVTGTGLFPFDMLRHDACWPVSGDDASKMNMSQSDPRYSQPRSIHLRSYSPPEVGRWQSFTWSVGLQPLDKFHS